MNSANKIDQQASRSPAEEYLGNLRAFLESQHEAVGQFEYTSGNYDDAGRLIERMIPTITTELCEIGIHGDVLYLVVILPTDRFSKDVFDGVCNQDIKIYGLKDFKTTLFERGNPASFEGVQRSPHDDFVQIQFDFPWREMNVEDVGVKYAQVKESFRGAEVVNQLATRLDGEAAAVVSGDDSLIAADPAPKQDSPRQDRFLYPQFCDQTRDQAPGGRKIANLGRLPLI